VFGRKRKWVGQVVQVSRRRDDLSGRPKPRELAAIGQRRQLGDRPTSISDFDRLARLNAPQELARPLAQFPNANAHHVLFVAQTNHRRLPVEEVYLTTVDAADAASPSSRRRQRRHGVAARTVPPRAPNTLRTLGPPACACAARRRALRAEVVAVRERRMHDVLPITGQTVGLIRETLPVRDATKAALAGHEGNGRVMRMARAPEAGEIPNSPEANTPCWRQVRGGKEWRRKRDQW
jgi:hypothetical protein